MFIDLAKVFHTVDHKIYLKHQENIKQKEITCVDLRVT